MSQIRQQSIRVKRKRPRWQRFPLTFTRAVLALFGQFRLPVIAFLLVTIGGGFLYGELHTYAYSIDPEISTIENIPLIDRPYTMLQLMILETPPMYNQPPPIWYLIIFWYALPPIFVFIVGNGVADFVRLFFGDTWRKVRISNRQHHVIVLGAGHVGLRVVRWLREWGEDVVVVDNSIRDEKIATLKSLKTEMIEGDGRQAQALHDANIDDAAAFIACTGDDTVNLYALMRARAINPDLHIVGRIWDNSFNEQIEQYIVNTEGQQNTQSALLSSSDLSAPIFAGLALGIELTQTLMVNDIGYAAVRLMVQEGSILADRTIEQIQNENKADVVLYQASIGHIQVRPSRDRIVREGDSLVIFAREETCIDIAKNNSQSYDNMGHVILLGAGHVGLRVIRWLHSWGVPVVLIDNAIETEVREALTELSDENGSLRIVEADGRDKAALEAADIGNAMAFVACTGDDPINLYAIMRARAMNPDMQIVVRVWDDSFNEQIDRFILQPGENAKNHITSIRSSANLAAPIFAGIALGVELTQTLTVRNYEDDKELKLVAVRLLVESGSFFENKTVGAIQKQVYGKNQRADVVLHCPCDGLATMPPEHHSVVGAGDVLVIFAELNICIAMAKHNFSRERRQY